MVLGRLTPLRDVLQRCNCKVTNLMSHDELLVQCRPILCSGSHKSGRQINVVRNGKFRIMGREGEGRGFPIHMLSEGPLFSADRIGSGKSVGWSRG